MSGTVSQGGNNPNVSLLLNSASDEAGANSGSDDSGEECGPTPSGDDDASGEQLAEWIAQIAGLPNDEEANAAMVAATLQGGDAGLDTLLIGQTRDRVEYYAEQNGLSYYHNNDRYGGDEYQQLLANSQLIRGAMDRNMTIQSIGPDPDAEDLGYWYILEEVEAYERGYSIEQVDPTATETDPADLPSDVC